MNERAKEREKKMGGTSGIHLQKWHIWLDSWWIKRYEKSTLLGVHP